MLRRYRHLMSDLCEVLPHIKKEVKLDTKDNRDVINEVAELKGCTSTIFFEVRAKLGTRAATRVGLRACEFKAGLGVRR